MALKPFEGAKAVLGDKFVDAADASEWQWLGDGTYILHNVLSDSQLVQFVISTRDEDAEGKGEWHRTVGADEMRGLYAGWPAHLKDAIEKVRELHLSG